MKGIGLVALLAGWHGASIDRVFSRIPGVNWRGRSLWSFLRNGVSVGAGVVLFSSALNAQVFEIDWFTVDGGGDTSSGGGFSVSGTAGQSDAGELQGGGFAVIGGFWALVQVVQTPDAPQLSVSRDSNSGLITIAWPLPDDGWVLHQSLTLGEAPSPWVEVAPATYQTNATHRFITIPNPVGAKYFRLLRR